MLTPLLHVPRPGSETSEAVVGAYAFSATLAIQDITGLATSGVTASHIAKRLEPSAESEAMLFALVDREGLRPVTDLGYQELGLDDVSHVDAWVFVSLPLLEDLEVIEANIVYDSETAPLPGETWPDAPWQRALSLLDDLSASLNRPTRLVWVTHAPGKFEPPAMRSFGYARAFQEDQATFDVSCVGRLSPADSAAVDVVKGPGFGIARNVPVGELAEFSALLTSASRDYPRGTLRLETIQWDLQRIVDAGERLTDRGGTQLTGLARVANHLVGMCEVVQYASDDPKVCELGLIYVLPEYRGQGVGSAVIRAALESAREVWDDVETVYCSYPADSPAAAAIMGTLGASVVSSTTAWQATR